MNINVENSSPLRRKVTIELDQDEIGQELDRSYSELKRNVHLKGFRPGHAPRQMLERLFGDQVRGEVIQKLIKESTEKALTENHLTPVAEPEIVTEETDLKKALRFAAVFDIKPEIVVKDYARPQSPAAGGRSQRRASRRRAATLARADGAAQEGGGSHAG